MDNADKSVVQFNANCTKCEDCFYDDDMNYTCDGTL